MSRIPIVRSMKAVLLDYYNTPVWRRLLVFVGLPVFISAFYYLLIASDIYVSETKFSVDVQDPMQNSSTSFAASLAQSASPINAVQEALIINEFIHSATLVEQLNEKINLKGVYDHEDADFLSNLSPDVNWESFVSYYNNMVEIKLDEVSGIITLRAMAFSAGDSQKVSDAILSLTEDFVNRRSNRVQKDAVGFSETQVQQAEQAIIDANNELSEFRNIHKNFDPAATTEGVMGIIMSLESQLAAVEAEIANMRSFMREGSPQIESLQSKADALRGQIKQQTTRIATEGGAPLAKLAQQYEALVLKQEFAVNRYEMALESLESAQVDARKKSKYLLRIVEPTLPQVAQEPKRFKEILTVFLVTFIGYSIISLLVAAIKDHFVR